MTSPPDPEGGSGGGPSVRVPPNLTDGSVEPPPKANCDFVIAPERRRLDMYIVMDSNVAQLALGVWDVATEGLRRFVRSPEAHGTGVGIRYFGTVCDPEEYKRAEVEIDLLPNNAERLERSTQLRRLAASPMLPALQGGILHQRERATQHPSWKQVVVLISDGFSQDLTCPYTPQDLEQAAREGLAMSPAIETHLISMGVSAYSDALDELLRRFGAFNAIAAAGGSKSAVTPLKGDDPQAYHDALQTVRRLAEPCEYRAPANVAPDDFSVARAQAGQPLEEIPRVSSSARCLDQPGWYLSGAGETPVQMCPATCDWLQSSDANDVVFMLGCAPLTR